jgi:hypothetical protein
MVGPYTLWSSKFRTDKISMDVGPLARIGPNILVTDDADLLRRISGARSPYSRAEWYDGMRLDPRVNNVISERNEKRHTALRAKMASGVSLASFTIDECSFSRLSNKFVVFWQREPLFGTVHRRSLSGSNWPYSKKILIIRKRNTQAGLRTDITILYYGCSHRCCIRSSIRIPRKR